MRYGAVERAVTVAGLAAAPSVRFTQPFPGALPAPPGSISPSGVTFSAHRERVRTGGATRYSI